MKNSSDKKNKIKSFVLNKIRSIFLIPYFENILLNLYMHSKNKVLLRFIPPCYLYESPTMRYVNRDSINYKLDISSYSSWAIFWDIEHEKKYKLMFYNELSLGDIAIDIGLHVGQTAMSMALKVGASGHVYGFEPFPKTYENAIYNKKINNLNNLIIKNVAIGDETSTLFMKVATTKNAGMNFIDKDSKDGIAVKIITLDDFIVDNKLEKVSLIKIDVEGYELNVLKGAIGIIKKNMPILFIEIDEKNLKRNNVSPNDIILFLENIGYNSILNVQEGKKITSNDNFSNCHFDILAKLL